MNLDANLRRRITVAVVISVTVIVASYVVWGPNDSSSTLATDSTATPSTDTVVDVMGTVPVGYLGGEISGEEDVPVIVIPRPAESVNGYASWSRNIRRARDCLVPGAPLDAELTITNTDTGRRAACSNVLDPADYADRYDTDEALLHIDTFLALADINDAPIPIEVTW